MRSRRTERGFRRAGDLRADRLEMPPGRAKQLRLATAWRSVAGEAIARRAPARGIRRGVLEVEVPDERWASTLRDLIPRLAGRLSAAFPDLGVKKLRLLLPGVTGKPKASAIPAMEAADADEEIPTFADSEPPRDAGGPRGESGSDENERTTPAEVEARLKNLAERYLERASSRDQKP